MDKYTIDKKEPNVVFLLKDLKKNLVNDGCQNDFRINTITNGIDRNRRILVESSDKSISKGDASELTPV
jgi:hypothetical protein